MSTAAAVLPRKWNSSSFIEIAAAAAAGMRPSNASIGSSRCRLVVLLVCYLVSLSFIVYFSPFYVMLSAQRWHVSMTTAAVAASMNPTTTHRPFSPPHTRKRFTSKSFVALKNIFL